MNVDCEFEWEEDRSVGIWGGWVVSAWIDDGRYETTFAIIPDDNKPVNEWEAETVDHTFTKEIHHQPIPIPECYRKVALVSDVPQIVVECLEKRWAEIQEAERKNEAELARHFEEQERAEREAHAREDERDYLDSLEFDQGL